MKFSTLSLLLLSGTCQVAMAGNGGGATEATAPPVGVGCILASSLDTFISGLGGCEVNCEAADMATPNVEIGPFVAQAGCPARDVKFCFDFTGAGIDFSVEGTCSLCTRNRCDFNDLVATIDLNKLAAAVDFLPPVTVTDCKSEGYSVVNYLQSVYDNDGLDEAGIAHICPTTSICPNLRDRPGGRRLEEDQEEFYTLAHKCANFHYEGSLYVADHLFALGVPGEEAKHHGCPYVAVHSIVGDRSDPMSVTARKEILLWENKDDFESKFPSQGTYSFGEFSFNDLVEAYLKAETTNKEAGVYDVIGNSCGHFMVNLASQLSVKIDADVTAFVARRLLENSGKDFIAKIRSSAHFPSLLMDSGARRLRGDAGEEEELVAALIETTASGILMH